MLGELDEARDSPRRLQRLAVLLGSNDPTRAAAHVARLRRWAALHAPSGTLTGCSPRAIAQAAGWRGEPGVLLAALAGAGLLVRRPGGAWLRARAAGLASAGREACASQPPAASERATARQPVRQPAAAAERTTASLHAHALWTAALRELRGMVNEANFARSSGALSGCTRAAAG
ncbi:MAG: hypothetical protein IT306_08425 [Chloroflexi bacterium]|nr:hypothetical protein [Chloroflexota bacterium]